MLIPFLGHMRSGTVPGYWIVLQYDNDRDDYHWGNNTDNVRL